MSVSDSRGVHLGATLQPPVRSRIFLNVVGVETCKAAARGRKGSGENMQGLATPQIVPPLSLCRHAVEHLMA